MLTRGMTLRAVHAAAVDAPGEPGWMAPFLASLARDDLAPATLRGYHYGNERPRARPAGAPRQPPRTPPATLRAIPLPCTFTRMGLLILVDHDVRRQVALALARPAGLGQDLPHSIEREGLGDHAEADVVAEADAGGQAGRRTGHRCRSPKSKRQHGPAMSLCEPYWD